MRPSLPLPEDDEGRGFVQFVMSLDQALQDQDTIRLDPRSTSNSLSWASGWQVPLWKCLWKLANPRSTRSSSLNNAMLDSCMKQIERAMDAGSSDEELYCLLVPEMKRELDTRVCGAVLQKLIALRVGEGVSFSDCCRRMRKATESLRLTLPPYSR